MHPLGDLGSEEGPAVAYEWSSSTNLRWALALLPLALLLLLPGNRSPGGFLVLVPPVVLMLLALLGWGLGGILPDSFLAAMSVAVTLAYGLTTTWLFSARITGLSGRAAFAYSAALLVGVGMTPVLAGMGGDDAGPVAVGHAAVSMGVLLSMALGIRSGRKNASVARFVLFTLLWTWLSVAAVTFVSVLSHAVSVGEWIFILAMAFAGVFGGLFAGLAAAAIVGYYLLLAVNVRPFRGRLDGFLKRSPPPLPTAEASMQV